MVFMDAVERALPEGKGGDFTLYSALTILHVEWGAQYWPLMEPVQQRAAKVIKSWSIFQMSEV